MKTKIALFIVFVCIIVFSIFDDYSKAEAAGNKLKILVQIAANKDFKRVYRSEYSKDSYKGSTIVYSLQEDLTDFLRSRLSSAGSKGSWEAVFCESTEDFKENADDANAYLAMRVEITEYKSTYKGSSSSYRSYYELAVNCRVQRKNGMAWLEVFSKELTAKSTRSNEDEYFVSSVEKMADTLQTVLINQMVSYQVINSMAKDTRTKIIKAKVMNPSPYAIKRLSWVVPTEKENIKATTEGIIKSGETTEVAITIHSESSHAAIGWRNAYISEIVFGTSVK